MKNKEYKLLGGSLIIVLLILLVFFVNRQDISLLSSGQNTLEDEFVGDVNKEEDEVLNQGTEEVSENTIDILTLGNIIIHDKQIEGARINEDKYDFSPSFEYINDMILKADLSIGVLESTFTEGEPQGFPLFRTPDELLDNLKESGLDVINYANNHIIDGQADGFFRTIDVTEERNLGVLGIKKSEEDENYLIKEVEGEKIGIISYTFETPNINDKKTINGIKVDEEISNLINTFNYKELDAFYEKIDLEITNMKEDGAKFIIACIHWGEEYDTQPSDYQKQMALKLNELGVDILLGGHPHVIQPYETIIGEDGHETFVMYSQGNILSNQCEEEIGISESEDGFLAHLVLQVNDDNISLKEYEIIPTWVYREEKSDGTLNHRIIPVEDAIKYRGKYKLTDEAFERIQQSLNRTNNIIN